MGCSNCDAIRTSTYCPRHAKKYLKIVQKKKKELSLFLYLIILSELNDLSLLSQGKVEPLKVTWLSTSNGSLLSKHYKH